MTEHETFTQIRPCNPNDIDTIHSIINDGAEAYRSVIPPDRWHEPYMTLDELQREIGHGVEFSAYIEDGELLGVMGLQPVQDVTLIRHAYVRTRYRQRGIGSRLLRHLQGQGPGERPILIGTWAAAEWAIRFYRKHGFRQVTQTDKELLLRRYWDIPQRQIETSVVLADQRWWRRQYGD